MRGGFGKNWRRNKMIKPHNKPKNQKIYLCEINGEDILYYDKCPEKLARKLKDKEYSKRGSYNGALENLELTLQTATIYDEATERYSDTSIYQNKKGKYIKKHGKKYYIKDFQ